MPWAYTICMVMSGNGAGTGMEIIPDISVTDPGEHHSLIHTCLTSFFTIQ